jgi:carbamoyl-phosphate synthase large subunit
MEKPKKVLIIGSGPIQIGQAAEFDYSGSQACLSLKEEGITTVLVNSNPATIMTDMDVADISYIEPLTPEIVTKIIEKERPDAILPTMGGQTGLNLASALAAMGTLKQYDVRVLGTPIETIKNGEDRDAFAKLMKELNEPIPASKAVTSVKEALETAKEIGYPVIVRPAYTLGGSGGGIASNPEELERIATYGIQLSMIRQVLIEKSVAGWYEFEYEVVRDRKDNCIIICSMENVDPCGIHTGESIVVAPAQTLNDVENSRFKEASVKVIRALKVEGGCNIQFALHPITREYVVIEVNPRVSRSSALASKATGYPIARVSAKVAIGKTLDEIPNSITKKTPASFEPTIDYIVVKIPRWPFDKFKDADKHIGTQMKSTGEVMAIGRTFEEALQKAIRSLDIKKEGFIGTGEKNLDIIKENLIHPTDKRLYYIADAFNCGMTVADIEEHTKICPFFLEKMKNILDAQKTN